MKKKTQNSKTSKTLRFAGASISLILHLGLLAALSGVVFLDFEADRDAVEVQVREIPVIPETDVPNLPEPPVKEIDEPTFDDDTETIPVDIQVRIDVSMDSMPSSSEAQSVTHTKPIDFSVAPKNRSALVMNSLFASRRIFGSSSKGLGSSERSKAARKGLEWLAERQNEDGSWGVGGDANQRLALTGLASLAFLAYGETPLEGTFTDKVREGLRHLHHTFRNGNGGAYPGSVGFALSAYAMTEAAAVTNMGVLRSDAEARLKGIVQRVLGSRGGSFGEENVKHPSAWNYQALKSGTACGTETPGLRDATTRGLENLVLLCERDLFPSGGKDEKRSPLMVRASRLYCLHLMGGGKTRTSRRALKSLTDEVSKMAGGDLWKSGGPWALASWYYVGHALFAGFGGKGGAWKKWDENLGETLVRKQNRNGSWSTPAEDEDGKNGETSETFQGEENLLIYATSLSLLCLQTPRRYSLEYLDSTFETASLTNKFIDDGDLGIIIVGKRVE